MKFNPVIMVCMLVLTHCLLTCPVMAADKDRLFGDYLGRSVTELIMAEGPPRILPADAFIPTLRLAYDELEMLGYRYYVEYEALGHVLVRVNYHQLIEDSAPAPSNLGFILEPSAALGKSVPQIIAAAGAPWGRTMYYNSLYAADQLEYRYLTADAILRVYYDFDADAVAALSGHYIADLPPSVVKPFVMALDAANMGRLHTPKAVLLDYAVEISDDAAPDNTGWRYKRLATDSHCNYLLMAIATPAKGSLNMLMYFHDRTYQGGQSREADARHLDWLEQFARENPAGANFTPAPAVNGNQLKE